MRPLCRARRCSGARGLFVYVVKEDKTVTLRDVKTGPAENDATIVESGVEPGELIVVDGMDRLREGARVEMPTKDSAAPGKGSDGTRRKGGGRRKGGDAAGTGEKSGEKSGDEKSGVDKSGIDKSSSDKGSGKSAGEKRSGEKSDPVKSDAAKTDGAKGDAATDGGAKGSGEGRRRYREGRDKGGGAKSGEKAAE